jgi:protein-disulfide isomerase
MSHKWLTFLTLGFLTIVVLLFFWIRIQPIEVDREQIAALYEDVSEPTVTFVNPSKGAEEPAVTIIEYSDFQCSACVSLSSSLNIVLATYPDYVRVVWKDLPNESIHELSTPAAIAAHCADRQGMFWSYHDELFQRQSYLSETEFTQIAADLELDVEKFQNCYDTRDTLPIVKKDFDEAMGLELTSTPTMFINDEVYIGAVSFDELLDIVADQLSVIE